MAQIPIKSIGANIRVDDVVLEDPSFATQEAGQKMRALENLKTFTTTLKDKRKAAEEAEFYTRSITEAELDYSNKYIEMQNKARLNPDGASQGFQDYISQDIDRRLGEAPPEVKAKIESSLSGKLVSYSTRAATWENNTRVELIENSATQQLKLREEIAARTTSLPDAVRLYEESIESIDSLDGVLPPENLVVKRDQAKGKIFGRAAEALIVSDTGRALREFSSGQWDEWLNEPQKAKAINTAKNRMDSLNRVEKTRLSQIRRNEIAAIEMTGEGFNYDTIYETELLDGPDEANRHIARSAQARENYLIGQTIRSKTTKEMEELELEMQEEISTGTDREDFDLVVKQYNIMRNQREKVLKERQTDSYNAARASLGLNEVAPLDLIKEQERLGMVKSVMPKDQANAIVDRFETDGSPDVIMGMVDEISQAYNRDDGTLQVAFNDLRKAGLDPQVHVIAMMDPEKDAPYRRIATQVMNSSLSDIKDGLSSDDVEDIKSIENKVEEDLNPFVRSYVDFGNNTVDQFKPMMTLAKKMALFEYGRSGQIEESVSRATAFVNETYDYVPFKEEGVIFGNDEAPFLRVPREIHGRALSADVVKESLSKKKKQFTDNPEKLKNLTTLNDENYKDLVSQQAHWVTDPEDTFATLHVGQTMVLEDDGTEGGRPITVQFEDIADSLVVDKSDDTVSRVHDAVLSRDKDSLKAAMKMINDNPSKYGFLRQSVERAMDGL